MVADTMPMSDVQFVKWEPSKLMTARCMKLYKAAGTFDVVAKGDLVAIKLHVGEYGNTTHLNPVFVKEICEAVRQKGGKPFLTDSSTLYPGARHNAYDHYITAMAHGFGDCAPWIPGDGLKGEHGVIVPTKGILKEIEVAGAIAEADAMIVATHVKGHANAGAGGAIKNLGMGCTTPAGKKAQHGAICMEFRVEKCKGCGKCVEACFMHCIRLVEGRMLVDKGKCMSCGFCAAACKNDAIRQGDKDALPRALASAAYGVLSTFGKDKVSYVSFANNITQKCDCMASPGAPVHPDIGVFASDSAVSIDAAAFNIIGEQLTKMNHSDCFLQVKELRSFGYPGDLKPKVIEL